MEIQQPPSVPSKNINVLCIEDEFFISELYERALRKAGYNVTTALNGKDGLSLAQTNKYDIILLDLMVPEVTGMEILEILRDKTQTPIFDSKIVVTTNLVQDEAARKAIESQADGYIIKADITPRELVSFLETISIASKTS